MYTPPSRRPLDRLPLVLCAAGLLALSFGGVGGGNSGPPVERNDAGNGSSTGADAADTGGGLDTSDGGNGTTGDGDDSIVYDAGDTNLNPDCPDDACSVGSNRCKSMTVSQSCILGPDGCGRWARETDCRNNQVCVDGLCEDPTPCSTGNNDCSANAKCEVDSSTNKGYVCNCQSGYVDHRGDGTVCYPDYYKKIEAATFQMGSPSGEVGRDDSDETQHQVEITYDYVINEHEILQADWGQIVGNGFPTQGVSVCNSPPCPIFNVSWWDALFYANKLSERHGLETCYTLNGCSGTPGRDLQCNGVDFEGLDCNGYRLPTEAEWEYAARGGTTTATYAGDLQDPTSDSNVASIAWYDSNAEGKPHENMAKTLNDYGLGDTSGNVAEWVWDWYAPYGSGSATDPTGPSSGSGRVVRGGHYASPASACRSASRVGKSPTTRTKKIGFRIVRTLPAN